MIVLGNFDKYQKPKPETCEKKKILCATPKRAFLWQLDHGHLSYIPHYHGIALFIVEHP